MNANSIANRERQFKTFIQHCASNKLKYEYIDVHFSHKDERALEINELIKRNGYEKAFGDFAEAAENPSNPYHQTYQRMKRINPLKQGVPRMTPFGTNIYGILSKDAHKLLVRLSQISFPDTKNF